MIPGPACSARNEALRFGVASNRSLKAPVNPVPPLKGLGFLLAIYPGLTSWAKFVSPSGLFTW